MPNKSVNYLVDMINSNIKFDFFIKTNKNFVMIENKLKMEDLKKMFLEPIKNFLKETEAEFYDPISGNSNGVEIEKIGDTNFEIMEVLRNSVSANYDASIFKSVSDFKWMALRINSDDDISLKSIFLIYKQRAIKKVTMTSGLKILTQGHERPLLIKDVPIDGVYLTNDNFPDLIYALSNEADESFFCLLSRNQAEYLLDIEKIFKGLVENVKNTMEDEKIFLDIGHIEDFLNEMKSKKSTYRKLVKMARQNAFKTYKENILSVPKVIEEFELNIKFDTENNTIDLEKSSKEDILHLIADDYVLKYLSGRKEIAEKTKNINREE